METTRNIGTMDNLVTMETQKNSTRTLMEVNIYMNYRSKRNYGNYGIYMIYWNSRNCRNYENYGIWGKNENGL